MRFSLALIGLCAASTAQALALPLTPEAAAVEQPAVLEKRAGVAVAILTAAGGAAASAITTQAINAAASLIKDLSNWEGAREEFTKATTSKMWSSNPDRSRYPAVACYNKGYSLRDNNGKAGLISARLSLGVLNTDYDCMYMTGNNQFYTHGDGGYINLAYQYDSGRCSFDGSTGDLSCN